MKRVMGILLLISGMVTAVTAQKVGSALVQDNFCKPLNTSRWIVEMVPTPQSSGWPLISAIDTCLRATASLSRMTR
ncbi:hypothetical protein [Chitinophaga agri]|uniref:hypothetical protein n=1 Tax=Chitinophaga agri TaxID=2703787 RepID=UPI0013907D7D|nr:hypothetical protein [Chitinophaga agri]